MSRKPPPTVIDLEGQSGQGTQMMPYSGVPATVEAVEDATPEPTESSNLFDRGEPDPLKDGQQKKEIDQQKKEIDQHEKEIGQQNRFVGYAQDLWAFCKVNKGQIAAIVVACFLMYWGHTSVEQNKETEGKIDDWGYTSTQQYKEILARLPNETTKKTIDDCQKNLTLADVKLATRDRQLDEKDRQLAEKDEAIRKLQDQAKENFEIACLDRGSNRYSVVYCNFTDCEKHRVDGRTGFGASITPTEYFPRECMEGYAITDVSCYSEKGIAGMPKERGHPGCPGKKQFQCVSAGVRPDYYGHDFFRDVHGVYIACRIQAIN